MYDQEELDAAFAIDTQVIPGRDFEASEPENKPIANSFGTVILVEKTIRLVKWNGILEDQHYIMGEIPQVSSFDAEGTRYDLYRHIPRRGEWINCAKQSLWIFFNK